VQEYYSYSDVLQGYMRGTVLQGSRISSAVQVYRSSTVEHGYNYSARVNG
jgi:hypothetical protein